VKCSPAVAGIPGRWNLEIVVVMVQVRCRQKLSAAEESPPTSAGIPRQRNQSKAGISGMVAGIRGYSARW